MNKNKLTAFLLSAALVFTQGITVFAQTQQNEPSAANYAMVTPYWNNVNDVSLYLSFSGGSAYCDGTITGATGTTSIDATFKLERKTSSGWTLEKSWTKTGSSKTLLWTGNTAVSSGNTYRLSVSAKVVNGGVSETVSTSVEGSN
ncbi:MAG: hypothetical protein ACRCW1_09855 [Anaerotignaceae bacterium]